MDPVATKLELNKDVSTFLCKTHRMFIDGQWVEPASGQILEVYNPAGGEIIAQVPSGDAHDIDRAVKAARLAFEKGPWSSMTPAIRSELIWKIGDLITQHQAELAELEALDNGKSILVARKVDIPFAAESFHYMAGWATKIEGRTIPLSVPSESGTQYHAFTQREPIGVVGQIIPWNFPLLMAAEKIAPALACGCTVVLKVAEETPLSALRLGELIQAAGIPDGVVNIVTGLGETAGAALAAHPGVDKVAFTGSTEVGKSIINAAAGDLKKLTLELGGKSPNIVFADADLEAAIRGAANAIFFNHGQSCTAGSRLYVQEKVFDEVVEGVSEFAASIRLGPGLDPQTEMGPLVSQEQLKRVCNYLDSGLREGARAVTGGKRLERSGYFVEPTVLVDTRPEMQVVQEEIFGPVVTAIPFDEADEVLIERANDTIYGLAAGIWSKDLAKAQKLASKLRTGTVWVNCYNIFDPALPFGGYKQSGWGREMGRVALDGYTELKSVCIRL